MMLEALRQAAQAALPEDVWRHLQQGAHDALAPSPSCFDAVALTPRPLRALTQGHTRLTLFGETLAHPFLVAPLAYARLFHPDGDAGMAMAATAQCGQSLLSSLASQTIADVAAAHRGGLAPVPDVQIAGAPWFQLYWQGDRDTTAVLLQQALAQGCPVVVLTVDAPVKTGGIALPDGVHAVNLPPRAAHPPASGQVFQHWMAQAPTWDDVRWLRERCPVPLLLKGITHPDDARQARETGAAGVIVSNHGGRALDTVPATAELLPRIVEAVGGDGPQALPVLVDGGIRRGTDVLKALGLGARAVLVGRPQMHALAVAGAQGVAHMLRLLRDELEIAMALSGCRTLADASPSLLWPGACLTHPR